MVNFCVLTANIINSVRTLPSYFVIFEVILQQCFEFQFYFIRKIKKWTKVVFYNSSMPAWSSDYNNFTNTFILSHTKLIMSATTHATSSLEPVLATETPGPGMLWEIINYDQKLGKRMHALNKNNSALKILSEAFSFSVDEVLWIGVTCAVGFLLCCTRGFGHLGPIGCVEEAMW